LPEAQARAGWLAGVRHGICEFEKSDVLGACRVLSHDFRQRVRKDKRARSDVRAFSIGAAFAVSDLSAHVVG
jgi:hypothetical protein